VSELLQPRTDAGVVAQALVLGAVWAAGWWWARRRPDARLLVTGAGLVLLALLGLRAAH
jgi:hypothetical protein